MCESVKFYIIFNKIPFQHNKNFISRIKYIIINNT